MCISFSWVSSALRLCGIRMSISFSWYYRRCVSVAASCSSASVGIIGVRQPVTIGVSSGVVSLCSSAPVGIIGVRQGGIIVWSASVGLIGVRYGGIIVLISWVSSAFVSVASSGSSASYPSSASSLAYHHWVQQQLGRGVTCSLSLVQHKEAQRAPGVVATRSRWTYCVSVGTMSDSPRKAYWVTMCVGVFGAGHRNVARLGSWWPEWPVLAVVGW